MDTLSKLTLIREKMQTVLAGDFSLEIVDDYLEIRGPAQNMSMVWDVLSYTKVLGAETDGWISLCYSDDMIYIPMDRISIIPREKTEFYYVIKAGDTPRIVKEYNDYETARKNCRALMEQSGGNDYYYVRTDTAIRENGNLD